MVRLPRFVVAAAASGQGKTTVAVGIMAALSRRGLDIAPAKVGPDYIDPGYHALATGRIGRNLDPWLQGEERLLPLLVNGFRTPRPADVAVIEGVMGLFDGRLGTQGWASTAHVATLTASPVVLVVDISSAARTVAATVHGLRTFDPTVRVAGVVLNKSGSARHADEVRRSVEGTGVPVLGVLPRDAGVSAPSRHLGLVPAAERPEAETALDHLAEQTTRFVDLDALLEIAATAPEIEGVPWSPPTRLHAPTRIVAVAGGRAFTFRYAETDELLRALGCEPVVFDPAVDTSLPAGTSGIYLGGGFPEVYAASLATNRTLLGQVRDAVSSGVPTVAECAGLLYLSAAVDGHDLVGAIPARASMHSRLTLSYRTATTNHDSLLGPAGTTVRGHEFHRTRVDPGHGPEPAWLLDGEPEGFSLSPNGRPTVHASYLHTHWAGHPELAEGFAAAVHEFAGPGFASHEFASHEFASPAPHHHSTVLEAEVDLEHHGDVELDRTLVDFAVNVRVTEPPAWLATDLRTAIGELAAYPRVGAARAALARRHGVPETMVLPTNGAAEAFVLLAQALAPTRAVVVHPQFTEPEVTLRRAGHVVHRHLLDATTGFTLTPSALDPVCDLVVIGNPTNPTGVLHPRDQIDALRSPGRVVVVDEAFMDAVPGERESLIDTDMTGLLVLRSLTKTWGLAGLRAGYVVGDPTLVARLGSVQPHWSVNTLAAVAMERASTPPALTEAATAAGELSAWRDHLVRGLNRLGPHVQPSSAPFVLTRVGVGVREALRANGYAVRRGDTFPGLGPQWVRIAVRDPHTTDGLLRELAAVLAQTEEQSA